MFVCHKRRLVNDSDYILVTYHHRMQPLFRAEDLHRALQAACTWKIVMGGLSKRRKWFLHLFLLSSPTNLSSFFKQTGHRWCGCLTIRVVVGFITIVWNPFKGIDYFVWCKSCLKTHLWSSSRLPDPFMRQAKYMQWSRPRRCSSSWTVTWIWTSDKLPLIP